MYMLLINILFQRKTETIKRGKEGKTKNTEGRTKKVALGLQDFKFYHKI